MYGVFDRISSATQFLQIAAANSFSQVIFWLLEIRKRAICYVKLKVTESQLLHHTENDNNDISNKSAFSFIRQLSTLHSPQLQLSAICCWASAPAAQRTCCKRAVQQSIDISCPPGAQRQTRCTPLGRSTGQIEGRTDARPFHRPCSAYYAGSVNNNIVYDPKWPLS